VQGAAKQDGVDLKNEATIVYGAPALLAEKALQGEMDAVLNFWNFCAGLEAKGFRRVVESRMSWESSAPKAALR